MTISAVQRKETARQRAQRFMLKNPNYIRGWYRKNIINSSSGRIRVDKRDYPIGDICEICNKPTKRLWYHHWDDEFPAAGLWLCINCHGKAEAVESGFLEVYSQLKEKVEKEICTREVSKLLVIEEFSDTAEKLLAAIGREE